MVRLVADNSYSKARLHANLVLWYGWNRTSFNVVHGSDALSTGTSRLNEK